MTKIAHNTKLQELINEFLWHNLSRKDFFTAYNDIKDKNKDKNKEL